MKKILIQIEQKLNYQKTINKLKFVAIVSRLVLFIRGLIGIKSTLVTKKRLGVYWELELKEAIDFCLYAFNNYEPELLNFMRKKLTQDSVLVDIGANIGAHTIPMAKHLSRGKVYAIEPTNFAFNKLKTNLSLNKEIKNISIEKVFLTNKAKEKFKTVSSSWDISNIKDPKRNQLDGGFSQSVEEAEFLTLDEWFVRSDLKKIEYIKLDVDGHEIDVLSGADYVLSTFHPKLFLELSPIHFSYHRHNFSGLIDILKKYNYQIEDMFGQKLDLNVEFLESYIPYGALVNIYAYNGAADKD